MPDLHLISHDLCPYVQRAIIVLTEKRIEHRRTYIDLANKPDWFLKLSPLGRTPVPKAGNAVIFESQVIVEYLDEITAGTLHPTLPLHKARHRSWIEFGSETLNAIAGFYNASEFTDFEAKARALRLKLERIDREIAGPFFAGDNFHIVDAVWGTVFRYFDVFDRISDFGLTSNLANIARWRAALSTRSSVQRAVAADYPEKLVAFLSTRDSHLSTLIPATPSRNMRA
ncbi:MAG: glutathione S-transferase family protein [Pseudomonadota bacterium]